MAAHDEDFIGTMSRMKFGVFDHLDASGRPLGEFYEQRLRLVEAYERIGLHCYHTAEHHATQRDFRPALITQRALA